MGTLGSWWHININIFSGEKKTALTKCGPWDLLWRVVQAVRSWWAGADGERSGGQRTARALCSSSRQWKSSPLGRQKWVQSWTLRRPRRCGPMWKQAMAKWCGTPPKLTNPRIAWSTEKWEWWGGQWVKECLVGIGPPK